MAILGESSRDEKSSSKQGQSLLYRGPLTSQQLRSELSRKVAESLTPYCYFTKLHLIAL
jgi:hypothetical protein